ncbi:right-handed parallel beta-helix repeat-containing protein [Paenibacillus sp. alder61]|uniref:right-handed parallel beta-helix repeat-containing protein n=1 Tax=Paenibacillus sp. alder61 TaxID=2862948 RepID=UPI001CD6D6F9|nr:right-handed parallel beta-helix repeat-containing protein [Paenibacillus sp. alder61]MCA1292149.1 right-handed parallel beta-helix repeat-containing protein [Paenibacillus sp. alder61]
MENEPKKTTCYIIEPSAWGIRTDGTDAVKTTDGLNQAIAYAKNAGYPEVFIPKGTYLIQGVGTAYPASPEKGAGIHVPSHLKLTLDHEAELKVEPNSSKGYSCIYLRKVENVTISGGIITGDLDQHDFSKLPKSTQEWGLGIYVHGGKNITIENMKIRKCTGDCILLGPVGLLGMDPDYDKPEKVSIRNCQLDGARRNNISLTAGEGVFVENNEITNAGTVKGTKPCAGIDIEGYGEGDIDYEEPRKIVIRGNVFRGNAESSVLSFNGYEVIIDGNHSDNTLSYGNGTDTVISNNVLLRTDNARVAIAGQKVSNGLDGNNVTIVGNSIKGFSSGIDARGKDVVVTGNTVSHLGSASGTGIGVWDAENVLITDNAVHRGQGLAYKVDNSKDVQLLNNKAYQSDRYGMEVDKSQEVVLRGNVFSRCKGGIQITNRGTTGTQVLAEGNHIDCTGYTGQSTYTISFDKSSDVAIKSNYIRGARNIAIYGASAAGRSVKITDNEIVDSTGVTAAIQLDGGARAEIAGNRITYDRTADGGYGIILLNTVDALVAENSIGSHSNFALNGSIVTEKANSTKVVNNLAIKGILKLNEKTDTNLGNTVIV